MGSSAAELSWMTQRYELDIYRHAQLQATLLLHGDEDARRSKVRMLVMRDENVSLKDRTRHSHAACLASTNENAQLRVALGRAQQSLRIQVAQAKKQGLELETVRAEVAVLNESLRDLGKTSQEKFALARELNRLNPEIEYLSSQLLNHQAVIAERNDMQRQHDTLEVELENERRAKLRAQNKMDNDVLKEMRQRVDDAEQRLSTEKSENAKDDKKHIQELQTLKSREIELRGHISALDSKLEESQTQLVTTNAELVALRATFDKPHNQQNTSTRPAKSAAIEQSRRAHRVEDTCIEDITIDTPGDDVPRARWPVKMSRAGKEPLNQKSDFSITPFLNRGKRISFESPEQSRSRGAPGLFTDATLSRPMGAIEMASNVSDDGPSVATEQGPQDSQSKLMLQGRKSIIKDRESDVAGLDAAEKKPRGRPRIKENKMAVAHESPEGKSPPPTGLASENATQNSLTGAKDVHVSRGHESAHQTESQIDRGNAQLVSLAPTTAQGLKMSALDAEGRKRKRLLGSTRSTVFDDEDKEHFGRPGKSHLGLSRRKLVSGAGSSASIFGGGPSFSPLKRDKRGNHASFLA